MASLHYIANFSSEAASKTYNRQVRHSNIQNMTHAWAHCPANENAPSDTIDALDMSFGSHYHHDGPYDPVTRDWYGQLTNPPNAWTPCPANENSPSDMIDALDTSFGSHYHHDGPYDPATRHCYGQLTNPPIAAISDHMWHPFEEGNAEEFADHRESHILVGHWPGQEFATAGARAVELDKEQRENHQRLRAYRKRRIISFWLPCLGGADAIIGTKF
ncbi:hypothetical protein POJ06DRAFT_243404 [Lipomyces tetrasporus]|uniref:Uncharacterized protein n=1 Tax=Lipomyces tetrasporus TaxID=54092 RepID=A0AAD7QZ26_9ASCO|nr:uncharacterized protein POJ06DRAFT_243404 [Lipomyces tetrasporus]KAJ8104039.1 hypothetical protein POJ06DRAFT_243404 [Lipomyces tetrasporus]